MAARKYARYGPPDRYEAPPAAGMCLTAVAVIRRGRKVLLGRVADHPRWRDEWMTTFQAYSREEMREAHAELRLPGAYLREGEHPDRALQRILRDQLRAPRYTATKPEVLSWYSLSTEWYPGKRHWDLLFAYRVKTSLPAKTPPWWTDLGWVDVADLHARDFGWNRELMVELGLLRSSPAWASLRYLPSRGISPSAPGPPSVARERR